MDSNSTTKVSQQSGSYSAFTGNTARFVGWSLVAVVAVGATGWLMLASFGIHLVRGI